MCTTERPSYKYTTLLGPNAIRLLRLNTRSENEPTLTGSLILHNLDDAEQQYTTLSYSWGRNSDGDVSLRHKILLDGCELRITENLHDFLTQISGPNCHQPSLLWVDAICINQDNILERGLQVSIMATIYQQASNLVIWLGHGNTEIEDLQVMEALCMYQYYAGDKRSARTSEALKFLSSNRTVLPMSKLQQCALAAAGALADNRRFGTLRRHLGNNIDRTFLRSHYRDPVDVICPDWLRECLHYTVDHLCPKLVRFALADSKHKRLFEQLFRSISGRDVLLPLRSSAKLLPLDALGCNLLKNHSMVLVKYFWVIERLCQRRYFNRRWIIQEIYQSSPEHIVLRWGSFSINLRAFTDLIRAFHYNLGDEVYAIQRYVNGPSEPLYTLPSYSFAWTVLQVRDQLAWAKKSNDIERILDCLVMFGHTSCADDHDLTFAFLSIAGSNVPLSSDYNLSADEVFIALETVLIEGVSVWRVLMLASCQWSKVNRQPTAEVRVSKDTALPTWVPNPRCPLTGAQSDGMWDRYRPGKGEENSEAKILDHGKILQIRVRIARLEPPSYSRDAQDGDYVCGPVRDGIRTTGLVVRRKECESGDFTVVGYVAIDELHAWDRLNTSVRTIRLC